jgi:hypothetical protein
LYKVGDFDQPLPNRYAGGSKKWNYTRSIGAAQFFLVMMIVPFVFENFYEDRRFEDSQFCVSSGLGLWRPQRRFGKIGNWEHYSGLFTVRHS